MAKISTGSVLQDSWNILYDVIIDQITDTSSEARAGSDFVFSAWPNRQTVSRAKWTGYPIVVMTNDIDRGMDFTINKGMRDWGIGFTIDVFNKSQKNADSMSDEILRILQNNSLKLEGSGLMNFNVESMSSTDFTDAGNSLVHQKTLNLGYNYRELN